ncbi:MAG: PAS domain S-box protein [Candidatus Omnitrophota bacterium]
MSENELSRDEMLNSPEFLRSIIDSLPGVAYVINDKAGFLWVNKKFSEVTGYGFQELIDRGPLALFYGEEKQRVAARIKDVFLHGHSDVEAYMSAKDGATTAYYFTGLRTEIGGTPFLVGMGIDITERKKFELELKGKTVFLEAQVEATIDGVLVVDSQGQRILSNQQLYKMWKVPQHIIDEKNDEVLLQYVVSKAKYPRQFIDKVRYLYSHQEETSRDEIEFLDGTVFDRYSSPVIDKSGNYLGRIWMFRDITERKQREEEINNSQKLLQRIINLLPIRVFWKDRNLKYLGCNEIFAKDAGKNSSEDLIGKNDSQMGWSEQAEIYQADDLKVMKSGKAKLNFEEPQTTPGGGKIWLKTSKVPLIDSQGKEIGVLGTYEDITERKQKESDMQQKVNELEMFNKITVEREIRMIELKKRILELEAQLHAKQE